MDSGNSGSISSSDEEYDSSSHPDPSFLNHFNSISHPQQQPSLVPSHPSMFDLSSSYIHALSQSHPNPLNLDSQGPTSQPNCTNPQTLPYSSSSTPTNQCLFGHDNINATTQVLSSTQTNNNVVVRNSKKRSRASRRAPTTVLTTDTTNFRSMVQEFTGTPPPPFSPSFSRRIPLRPNPLLSSSSRTNLFHNNNINVFSPNNNNNNSINYQLLPDLSLPYHHPSQNNNLMQQNHPIPSFNSFPSSLHSLVPEGFGAKSLSMPSLDDAHMMGAQSHQHDHVVSEGMLLRSIGEGEIRRDTFTCLDVGKNMNRDKKNNENSTREGAVEAWICSSHQEDSMACVLRE